MCLLMQTYTHATHTLFSTLQTSTMGQYAIDCAAGRGLLSPAMVQAGESSVSYVLALIGNLPWQSCSNLTTSPPPTLTAHLPPLLSLEMLHCAVGAFKAFLLFSVLRKKVTIWKRIEHNETETR